jgi:hypothetical protein
VDDDLRRVPRDRVEHRGVVADVGPYVGEPVAHARELEERRRRGHLVGVAGDMGAHRLQPQRQPRPLEAGVTRDENRAAAPELRIHEARHEGLMLVIGADRPPGGHRHRAPGDRRPE